MKSFHNVMQYRKAKLETEGRKSEREKRTLGKKEFCVNFLLVGIKWLRKKKAKKSDRETVSH